MTGASKTGGMSTAWVTLESPKPPPVQGHCQYWQDPPPAPSPRCEYWVRQIQRGWRPNRRIRMEGYYSSAEWYGIYIWEYLNVISPMISQLTD